MDAVPRVLDERIDFLDPDDAAVIELLSTSRYVPAVMHGKDQGLMECLVVFVEWAVDEGVRIGGQGRGRVTALVTQHLLNSSPYLRPAR